MLSSAHSELLHHSLVAPVLSQGSLCDHKPKASPRSTQLSTDQHSSCSPHPCSQTLPTRDEEGAASTHGADVVHRAGLLWPWPPPPPQLPRPGRPQPLPVDLGWPCVLGHQVVHGRREVTTAGRGQQFPDVPSPVHGMRVLVGPAGTPLASWMSCRVRGCQGALPEQGWVSCTGGGLSGCPLPPTPWATAGMAQGPLPPSWAQGTPVLGSR